MKNFKFYFFCYSVSGFGLSGGERIFLELTRVLLRKKYQVTFYSWEIIKNRIKKSSLLNSNLHIKISKIEKWIGNSILRHYLFSTIASISCALSIKMENSPVTIIYSSSDFWMDVFPSIILKIRFKHIRWIATWYQTAPSPLRGYAIGKRTEKYRMNAFLIWFSQLPIKLLIQIWADFVIVNNDDERKQFKHLDMKKKVIVMLGGVDVKKIDKWKAKHRNMHKKFDAVFQGRFHPQKGVLELIDIWSEVVKKKPTAILAMIGDGPLMVQVKEKINKLKLNRNMQLFGYVFDGDLKYTIFQQSRLVVHPAFYDSGGMASGEAMAFGIPCIGFKLRSYDSYYPMGMYKVPIGNEKSFAEAIVLLQRNKKLYQKLAKEARILIKKEWGWDTKAETLLQILSISPKQ